MSDVSPVEQKGKNTQVAALDAKNGPAPFTNPTPPSQREKLRVCYGRRPLIAAEILKSPNLRSYACICSSTQIDARFCEFR